MFCLIFGVLAVFGYMASIDFLQETTLLLLLLPFYITYRWRKMINTLGQFAYGIDTLDDAMTIDAKCKDGDEQFLKNDMYWQPSLKPGKRITLLRL